MRPMGPTRMDGYVRVSRRMGRGGPGYISPNVQREAIQRWADYRNVEIVAWHVDEDESGGTQARPALRAAMARIEAGETDGLACWRLNRFARNVGAAIADVKRIHAAGAHLACVEEDIDPTGPFGAFILTVLLAVATLERDNAVAGFEEAKRRAVARGAYVSRTPFGYERNSDGTLAPHPEDAVHVSEAFRLAAGDSIHTALGYLRQHVPERRWTTTKVRRLLSGRSYLGETRNGDLVQADTHEPLVASGIWAAAQTTPIRRQPPELAPLSGLIRCATCTQPMVGSRGGKGQRVYRCSGTQSSHTFRGQRCRKGAVITASILERYLHDQTSALLAGLSATISDPKADSLDLLERALMDAEAELDAFAADTTLRRALGERYHQHLDSRVEAVQKARAAYRHRAREAQTALTLTTSDIEADPQLFPLALSSLFESILVSPGRGLGVAERVRLVPLDHDRTTGVPDAKRV